MFLPWQTSYRHKTTTTFYGNLIHWIFGSKSVVFFTFEPPHEKKQQQQNDIRPVWSESLLCAQCLAKDPSFLHADSEAWSDWAGAQANLSLRWAHMSFCWFDHAVAHFLLIPPQWNDRFHVWCIWLAYLSSGPQYHKSKSSRPILR